MTLLVLLCVSDFSAADSVEQHKTCMEVEVPEYCSSTRNRSQAMQGTPLLE